MVPRADFYFGVGPVRFVRQGPRPRAALLADRGVHRAVGLLLGGGVEALGQFAGAAAGGEHRGRVAQAVTDSQ